VSETEEGDTAISSDDNAVMITYSHKPLQLGRHHEDVGVEWQAELTGESVIHAITVRNRQQRIETAETAQ